MTSSLGRFPFRRFPFRSVPTILGLLACLVDSLLGGTLQARYRTASGALSDAPVADAHDLRPAAGVTWLDNDRVNLACTAVGAAVPLFVLG